MGPRDKIERIPQPNGAFACREERTSMTVDIADDHHDTAEHPTDYSNPGILGVSIREAAIIGVWLVAFVISFFPLGVVSTGSVWQASIHWLLQIGVPTVAVFLLVLRRFSPQGIRRVGSLGIDQFASVAFSVATVVWLTSLWDLIALSAQNATNLVGWVTVVETVAMLALIVLTVFAPLIPVLRRDFEGREQIPAHRNANAVRAITPRAPRPEPVAAVAAPSIIAQAESEFPEYATPSPQQTAVFEQASFAAEQPPFAAETDIEPGVASADADSEDDVLLRAGEDPSDELEGTVLADDATGSEGPGEPELAAAAEPASAQEEQSAPVTFAPHWVLAPQERAVVDAEGRELFRIGPTAWALVVEDRGSAYVIRHDDGRTGFLHDIDDVIRG